MWWEKKKTKTILVPLISLIILQIIFGSCIFLQLLLIERKITNVPLEFSLISKKKKHTHLSFFPTTKREKKKGKCLFFFVLYCDHLALKIGIFMSPLSLSLSPNEENLERREREVFLNRKQIVSIFFFSDPPFSWCILIWNKKKWLVEGMVL